MQTSLDKATLEDITERCEDCGEVYFKQEEDCPICNYKVDLEDNKEEDHE